MRPFSYVRATDEAEAAAALSDGAEYLAGARRWST